LVKTVDIRTDSGYVLLVHEDPEVLERDYRRILELQRTMFDVEGEEAEEEAQEEGTEAEGTEIEGAETGVGLDATEKVASMTPHYTQHDYHSPSHITGVTSLVPQNALPLGLPRRLIRSIARSAILLSAGYALSLLFVALLPLWCYRTLRPCLATYAAGSPDRAPPPPPAAPPPRRCSESSQAGLEPPLLPPPPPVS